LLKTKELFQFHEWSTRLYRNYFFMLFASLNVNIVILVQVKDQELLENETK